MLLRHCHDYSRQALGEGCGLLLERLCDPRELYSKAVLLKPNLISSRGPALACTNGNFLAEVATWFLDHGARVRIGDSPAFGSTASVLERQGIKSLLDPLDVKLIPFRQPVERRLENGFRVRVAAEALDCDLFVNLPKLKAHSQMYLTAAVKNIFGIVVGMRKAMLHMRHGADHRQFAEIILGLAALLPPNVSLLDGIEVMHGSGPVNGVPLALGCIAGAANPVALDTAVLELLELPAGRSPLWQAAAAACHAGSRPEELHYPLEKPIDFSGSGFLAPATLNSIRFRPRRFLMNSIKKICACLSS